MKTLSGRKMLILSITQAALGWSSLHKSSKKNYEHKLQKGTDKSKSGERKCTFPKNHQQLFELHVQLYPWKRKGLEDLMHKRQETECG